MRPAPAIKLPRFTLEKAAVCAEAWGFNCGPAALAAICDLTPEEARQYLVGFDRKRYTNPMMMFQALRDIPDLEWCKIGAEWPDHGLARIQWHGRWMEPQVPRRARYRHTHWVGTHKTATQRGVFDVNFLGNGSGWCSIAVWRTYVVPWILKECEPKSNGGWSVTHGLEVRASLGPRDG